jgi:Cu(I)/Ag(I) efflux system membrane fusion protein
MQRVSLAVAVVAAIAVSYGVGRLHSPSPAAGHAGRRVLYYVDPMHPSYRSGTPGIAPDCGMQLEPVYAGGGGNTPSPPSAAPAEAVSIDGATQRLVGIRLARVERGGTVRNIRAVGRVVPEDTRIYKVNSGVDGIIEETYHDSVGLLVKKDQKLAAYYAPDFLTSASGFLAANERLPGTVTKDGARSLQTYTDRLRNLGMSDLQINQVAQSRRLPETIDVVSPADGFILARNISPGQHFEHDMEFYRIADLHRVWVLAEMEEEDAPYLHPGGPAEIIVKDQGRRLPARISDSLPQSEAGGGTVKLRLELENPGFHLRPEMLVDVVLPVRLPPAVTVPLDAVIDSGSRARVYIESREGIFEPREVETGWRSNERVQILKGVQPGELVVAAATFLVDSESRLKSPASDADRAPGKPAGIPEQMAAAKVVMDPSCGMHVDPVRAAASGNDLTDRGATYYFCSRQCKLAFQKRHQ